MKALVLLPFVVIGCAAPQGPDPRYPVRAEGCAVELYPDAPLVQTDNLGAVSASCADSVADQDCMRTLKDEACKLGGDVVWGVPEKPKEKDGRKYWSGRAAHTKQAPSTPVPTQLPSG